MVVVLSPPRVRPRPPRAEPLACTPFWPPGARAIAALEPGQCRWPIGEVHEDGFGFCAAPRHRGSYCAAHGRTSRTGAGR